jgi:short-subunit dehydrogenase
VLLPQILERKKQDPLSKSAIVVTSSFAANIPMAGFATYSASKRLSSSLGEILHFEMGNRIEVLSW